MLQGRAKRVHFTLAAEAPQVPSKKAAGVKIVRLYVVFLFERASFQRWCLENRYGRTVRRDGDILGLLNKRLEVPLRIPFRDLTEGVAGDRRLRKGRGEDPPHAAPQLDVAVAASQSLKIPRRFLELLLHGHEQRMAAVLQRFVLDLVLHFMLIEGMQPWRHPHRIVTVQLKGDHFARPRAAVIPAPLVRSPAAKGIPDLFSPPLVP